MREKSIFPYGAVFKIERSFSMEHIKKNLEMMKDSGMDTVVIWPAVYWWEDKNIPGYPFNTGKKILEMAEELDLDFFFSDRVVCPVSLSSVKAEDKSPEVRLCMSLYLPGAIRLRYFGSISRARKVSAKSSVALSSA